MLKFPTARLIMKDMLKLWKTKDERIPEIKAALKTVPSRFRSLSSKEKRTLLAVVIFIIAAQVNLLLA